jgi:hypothetical protein
MMEAMLTSAPRPDARSSSKPSRATRTTPSRLTSRIFTQSASLMWRKSPRTLRPALLIRMSRRPCALLTLRNSCVTSCPRLTSAVTAVALPPPAAIAAATASALAASTSPT